MLEKLTLEELKFQKLLIRNLLLIKNLNSQEDKNYGVQDRCFKPDDKGT